MYGTQLPDKLKSDATDFVTAALKSVCGVIPYAGSFFAEIVGAIIPQQRMDRIAQFVMELDLRIGDLEGGIIRSHLKDEEFTDLVEESIRQVLRSTTDERRGYLASMISRSLTRDEVNHSETKHLMRILGELNDVEVVWLKNYQYPTMGGNRDFRSRHKEVLRHRIAVAGSSTDELDQAALQESYQNHLISLGLLTGIVSRDIDGQTEFDQFTGNLKISYYQTSPLGNLLLRTIGLSDSEETKMRNKNVPGPE